MDEIKHKSPVTQTSSTDTTTTDPKVNLNLEIQGMQNTKMANKVRSKELEEVKDNEYVIPEDFFYNADDYVRTPHTATDIPLDLLMLYHSFGYECIKRSNLHLLDAQTLMFAAGNFVQILDIDKKTVAYIHSTSGGGIGALAVHPTRKYFAVAEKGSNPNIIIYEFPTLKLYRILRAGTEAAYANLDFSPDGEKLASIGSYPDYMMTIWSWRQEQILLRSKAFSQDVYKVAFSKEHDGHLCSSGTGHIRFWTMAKTFTGLKLQGELGRFGTTELTDISGFVELPDGKVLSGSEWGNMLLWDGGLIKVEITRKGRRSCHAGNIEQFFLDEGELITVGADGFVKVWDFESIDTADALDQSKMFELEPMAEMKVGSDVKLLSIVKSVVKEEPSVWFAQDAAGGIWKLDLSFSHTSQSPQQLYSFHSGAVTSMAASPIAHIFATTGQDGYLCLYDYLAKTRLCEKKFNSSGTSLLWIPKVCDRNCSSVFVGFADGVLRHVSLVKKDENTLDDQHASSITLKLTQVFKPHIKDITCMGIDGEGKVLATGSADGTVFFFNMEKSIKPIGFVELPDWVVSLHWSPITTGSKLLVSCKNGTVQEFTHPIGRNFDTSKTFQLPLPDLKVNEFVFVSVKDTLLQAEADKRKEKERAEALRRKAEQLERLKAQGNHGEEAADANTEEGQTDSAADEDVEEVLHQQGSLINGFYRGKEGRFWLTVDGWDSGYIYGCSFGAQASAGKENNEKNTQALKVPGIQDEPITAICFSKSGTYMALGLQNGMICVHSLVDGDIENVGSFWSWNVHDNQYGRVTDISISFDEKFLICVGEDGNIFVFSFMEETRLKKAIGLLEAKILAKTAESHSQPVDDIDDPNHYSIENEKQKSEYDRMLRLAEEKKQKVKKKIALLRSDFRKIRSKNSELPAYLQLRPEEFIIDPQIKVEFDNETQEKVKLLNLETGWEAEKQRIALDKFKNSFKDVVECEYILVRSFYSSHVVASYRSARFATAYFEPAADNLVNIGTAENVSCLTTDSGSRKPSLPVKVIRNASGEDKDNEKVEFVPVPKAQLAQKLEGKAAKNIEKAEQRKQKRLDRQKEWAELYRSKPDESYEDPKDLAMIFDAERHIGDFKLKTAHDYVVPEDQRLNAEKKRAQLIELKQWVHDCKHAFNRRLLALRDKKIKIIEETQALTAELRCVQDKLPESLHVPIRPVPAMSSDELPEKKLEYDVATLLKFRKEVLGKTDNFGIDVGNDSNLESSNAKGSTARTTLASEHRSRSISVASAMSSQAQTLASALVESLDNTDVISEQVEAEQTEVEKLIFEEEKIRLTCEREYLLSQIRRKLIEFDAELKLLRHDKFHLDVKLKNADLRLITLFEELILLKDFEKRENALAAKLLSKLQEKDEMEEKVEECKNHVERKKVDLDKLQEQDLALLTVFTQALGENNKFEAFLTKVFKKKIKRVKKKANLSEGNDSEEESDEESDEEYSSDDEEDSDENELDDSLCPSGCEPALFDQVCQLREKRLDLEEATAEGKKLHDIAKKDLDALMKKVKIIETALKAASTDLEAFQREKQQKLNELDVVVTLKLDQLQYLTGSALPRDLSQCLIFEKSTLDRLQRRIRELDKEKAEQKKLFRERQLRHVQLIRDKRTMALKIKELEKKVEEIQLLKFGRLVDLEKLETVSVNRAAEELRERLRVQEMENEDELADWDEKMAEHEMELVKATRDHTRRLETYTALLQERKCLELALDSRQKRLGSEFQGSRKSDLEERSRLVQLVHLQSQEIEAIKNEINVLSRKGGHILPPSQAPLGNTASQ